MKRVPSLFSRLSILTAALLSGCGGDGIELVDVTGTVTRNGVPVQGAVLQFIPEGPQGSSSFGVTDDQGRYELEFTRTRKGAMPGKSLVRITSDDNVVIGDTKYHRQEVFPPEWNEQSEHIVEVEGGKEIDFHIETDFDPRRPSRAELIDDLRYGGT